MRLSRSTKAVRSHLREKYARMLYDSGWGKLCRRKTFESYLGDIPEIPYIPTRTKNGGITTNYPHLIVVDDRIELYEACVLAGVRYPHDLPPDREESWCRPTLRHQQRPYWIRFAVRTLDSSRVAATTKRGMNDSPSSFEGLCFLVEHPAVVEKVLQRDALLLQGSHGGVSGNRYKVLYLEKAKPPYRAEFTVDELDCLL